MPLPSDFTPDRSKLFGSHGQRPWLHDVVKTPAMAAGLSDQVWTMREWITMPGVQRR